MNFLFNIIKYFIFKLLGIQPSQEFYIQLHSRALEGMNIGGSGKTDDSGEYNALEYIKKKLNANDDIVVFDVGANIGDYAKLIHNVFKNNISIFSFEPSLQTFQKLSINTKDITSIKRYNIGLGDQKTTLQLFSNAQESGLASLYKRRLDHLDIEMKYVENIEISTLDSFCNENKINHIHFLKMDVEGHELKVLNGAREMLESGKIDFIQFEFGGCNIDSKSFFQDFFYLLNANYKIYRILNNGLYEITNYSERHEIFLTANYLAERRK
jgi:FkbM family methyltransferase